MIRSSVTASRQSFDFEETKDDLGDPFAGLLGLVSSRDALWLGKPVPRYTSYPPATCFREGGGLAGDYKRLLCALPAEEPVSLYLHVPFCQSLCLYCGCHTMPVSSRDRLETYLSSLQREIENLALTSSRSRKIARIHFGGGSPNILSEKDLGLLLGSLARRFDLSGCREVAMELDPRLLTRGLARTLALVGINRVSLGVQDLTPEVQAAIGRVQPFDQVDRAVEWLRDAGIRKINMDLMYGLPLQSPVTIAQSVQQAVSLKPDRVALFSYAHVPQVKKHQKVLEQYILPGPYASLALEHAARSVLRECGYREIGIDHFARFDDSLVAAMDAGTMRRTFQGYTDDGAASLLGLGASSIGKLSSGYFQNAKDVDVYRHNVSTYGFGTAKGLTLTGEDKLRSAIIEKLMCYLSVDLESVCHAHHFSLAVLTEALEALHPFEEAGLVLRSGYKIKLTASHRMAVRVIASLFDKTIRDETTPVSRAQ